jgi:hypothetical protein
VAAERRRDDGSSSSARERRRARETKVWGAPGVEHSIHRGRGSTREAITGGNRRRLISLTPLMAGRGYERV